MYKLLIVDDEEEVRKGIIKKIDWESVNFEVPLEAENGCDALELIEDNVPDAVITDITMPLMDGLALAEKIHEHYPTIKTVILTGFDDFKFAQRAIKYGVTEYLLKPVLPQDINDLMLKLKALIDEEIQQKEDISRLRSHYIKSLPIIKDKFLTSLITGNPGKAEIEKRIHSYNLSLNGTIFAVAAGTLDDTCFFKDESGSIEDELCKFAVLNITREILERHSYGEAFYHDENLVIIFSARERDKKAFINKAGCILEEIRFNVERYLRVTCSIGLGSLCDSADKLKESYKNALSALEYKMLIGSNRVMYIEDVEPQSQDTTSVVFDESKEQLLISGIKFGSEKDVTKAVKALFDDIINTKASLKDYQLYFIEIIASLSKLARLFQQDLGEMLALGSNLYSELFKFSTIHEIRDWIESICQKLRQHISGKMQNRTKIMLDKAMDYIQRNYSDNTLSIQKLADYLHISACYLSMIFKKEANETFLKYLVKVRLEAAKEYLRNSSLSTSEIAEKVGYPDINYFSFFFKKNIGMSPREYRNKYLAAKET